MIEIFYRWKIVTWNIDAIWFDGMILWLAIYWELQVSRLSHGNDIEIHDGNQGPMNTNNKMIWDISGTYKHGLS